MKEKHSRKKFLKLAGLLLCLPALAPFSTACDDTTTTNLPKGTNYDILIEQKSTFIVKELAKSSSNDEIFQIPNDVLFDRKTDIPLDFVLRKTVVNGKAYFQVVEVKLIESENKNSFISGINLNDELVFSPEILLNEMAKQDSEETKKRVLKIQYLRGSK